MRLIDADAFKEYICNAYEQVKHMYPDGGEWARQITEDFCKDIDEQPTAEADPEWIPCSERLPEDKQVVFVQDTNGTMWIWKYFSENLKYKGPYQWEDENGEWQLIDEVVAWMPLPEPYKEEKQ